MTAVAPEITEEELLQRVADFLKEHDPKTTDKIEWLRARYDAGLAWVHFPVGRGGLGISRSLNAAVESAFRKAGAPDNNYGQNVIGLGMAAPTLVAWATPEQLDKYLRPLYTGENIWCQLFSEPGAGSDVANVATRAVKDADGTWVVNGQKVWTTLAQFADHAILVARTNPDVPKHAGLSYFVIDLQQPGVEIRPLRQITGEAEFNEVFLTNARIPASDLIGAEGDGWKVATTTLNNERVSIGGNAIPRGGMVWNAVEAWKNHPENHSGDLQERLMTLWVKAEAMRITGERLRQKMAAGQPGPEGSALKLVMPDITQATAGLELEIVGEGGLSYHDWTFKRSEGAMAGSSPGFRFLRTKGNSIEGGTNEILRNLISERVLGLPGEHRVDKEAAWKDLEK